MKVLLSGGNSSVARALAPLLAASCDVVTAGRTDCDFFLDLSASQEDILLPEDADVVVHTAAHFGGAGAEAIVAAESVNVLGTLKLCAWASHARVKHFVLVSSVFAGLDPGSAQYGIYALSKKHGDEAASFFCSTVPMTLTILRPSQIYGAEVSRAHQPFFYSIVDKAERGEDITIHGSRDPLRNYIHVDDVAAIIAKCVRSRPQGIFPCIHTQDTSYARIADAAFSAFGKGGRVVFAADMPDIPDNVFPHDHRLYERIGYYPGISIRQGMEKLALARQASR